MASYLEPSPAEERALPLPRRSHVHLSECSLCQFACLVPFVGLVECFFGPQRRIPRAAETGKEVVKGAQRGLGARRQQTRFGERREPPGHNVVKLQSEFVDRDPVLGEPALLLGGWPA